MKTTIVSKWRGGGKQILPNNYAKSAKNDCFDEAITMGEDERTTMAKNNKTLAAVTPSMQLTPMKPPPKNPPHCYNEDTTQGMTSHTIISI